jgi:hypothetical protein
MEVSIQEDVVLKRSVSLSTLYILLKIPRGGHRELHLLNECIQYLAPLPLSSLKVSFDEVPKEEKPYTFFYLRY